MYLSGCLWALTGPEQENLANMAELGFDWIDIQPHMLVDGECRALASSLNLRVSSVAASFGMGAAERLDGLHVHERQAALDRLRQVISGAVADGAAAIYLVPGRDDSPAALARYAGSMAQAAELAAAQQVMLCIEHFPGTALPTAAATLDFIRDVGHPNLYLLLDSGHLQMSGEAAEAVIPTAADRLGYVHLDDNDGVSDLHWALLDGVMTAESLGAIFAALEAIGYGGAVSLELNPNLDDPLDALRRSRQVVLDVGERYLR